MGFFVLSGCDIVLLMVKKKQTESRVFSSWLIAVPWVGLVIFILPPDYRSLTFMIVSLSALSAVVLYFFQLPFLKRAFPRYNLRPQLLLLAGAIGSVALASLAGDVFGALYFGNEVKGYFMYGALLWGGAVAAVFAYIMLVGNMSMDSIGHISDVRRVINRVFYFSGWLILAGISYLVYSTIFSLHDPDTE